MKKITIKNEFGNVEAVFIRIYDNRRQIYYASSRIGTVEITNKGFVITVDDSLINKEYEIKTLPGLKVQTGKIVFEKAKTELNNDPIDDKKK